MKNRRATWMLAAIFAVIAAKSDATDHIDGGFSVNAPTTDLTDLYAFTVGPQQEKLVVILNIVTAAQPWEYPNPAARFEIVFGAVSRGEASPELRLIPTPRYRISCTWQEHGATCIGPDAVRMEVPLDVITEPSPLRIFVGRRSDPFALNGIWASELAVKNSLPEPFDANIIQGFNVFSVVAEIDIGNVMPNLSGFAIALGAEVRDGTGDYILDRIGRPEIANIALQTNTGLDLRDELNTFPALEIPPGFRNQMLLRLRANLDRYDSMDPTPYQSDKDELAEILADDFLTIDTALPCNGARYFDLETAVLTGVPAVSCGGRPLQQDVIDSVYGLLVRGNARDDISDGVANPTRHPQERFPYLSEPNTGSIAILQALIGRVLSNFSVAGPSRLRAIVVFGATAVIFLLLLGLIARWIWRRFRTGLKCS